MLNPKALEKAVKDARATGKRSEVVDQNGLYLDVAGETSAVWRLRYRLNGKREKFTIGRYPSVGLAKARQIAAQLAGQVASGISPAEEARSAQKAERTARLAGTVAELAKRYIADLEKRGKTAKSIRWHVDAYIVPKLGRIKSLALTTDDVRRMCDAIAATAPSSAREVLGTTRRMLQLAVDQGLIPSNVAASIKPSVYADKATRDRNLSSDELRQVLQGFDTAGLTRTVRAAFLFIVLTMVRKNEALKATWGEFADDGLWQIPGSRVKTEAAHVVPLARQAKAILESMQPAGFEKIAPPVGWPVFPGIANKPLADNTLNEAMKRANWFGVQRFTVHDLRRTASTTLHEQGWSSDVIEKALNHTMIGVRGVYNRAMYLEQRREMLQTWADFLDAIKAGAKVVPFKKVAA